AAAVQALSAGALGAPAFDETDSGHVGCRAVADGAGLRLTGRKTLVPFPGRAASFVVLAVDAQQAPVLACVAPDAAGVRHVRAESGMGLLGLEGAALELDGAPAARLGGAELVARTLDDLRIAVAALLAGVARGAIDHALRYGQERRQFDRPLLEFGAVQERLASADARTFAVRASVHAAARLRDRGEPYGLAAARARRVAGETAVCAADDALQVFGGYGYSREYPAERFYRDARFTGFGEARPAALDAAVVRGLVG
ncbi:MAG TPA: acyl-CoA dehydrogenase family protein, partial [Planctomycetota bacterium]|nr:acyl-CoA dehydrogenase family protein [Planctomycetota bacterium]